MRVKHSQDNRWKNIIGNFDRKLIKNDVMNTFSKLAIALSLLTITGCTQTLQAPRWPEANIVGSGKLVSQSRSISGFDRINAGLVFDLSIRQGDEFSVIVTADDNWVDYLSTEVEGTTLILDYIDGYAYDVSGVTTRVEVTMPELIGLTLSSSAHAWLDDIQTSKPFEVEMTGSTYLNGALSADSLRFDIHGGSLVELSGSSRALGLDVCGSSLVDLSELRVEQAEIELACSDTTIVQVRERLVVEAAQSAQLYIVGNPESRVVNVYESASVLPYTE